MENDVTIRPFLEEPAGKDAVPFIVPAFLHIELHESARFLLGFPWGRRLAGAQAHDGIAYAQRFAGLHLELAGEAIALVEQAEHGLALRHRRAGQISAGARQRLVAGPFLAIGRIGAVVSIGRTGAATRDKKQQAEWKQPPARRRGPARPHASGAQAS